MRKRNFEYYCKDYNKIENYEKAKADNFIGWEPHHRLETHTSDGERRPVDISSEELKALNMYFNRPPEELIFLTKADHTYLHKKDKKQSDEHKRHNSESKKGHLVSEETKKKITETLKGKPHPHSKEQDRKLSNSLKGHLVSEETRKKISESLKRKPDRFKGRPSNKKGLHWKIIDGKRVYYK